MGLWWRVLIDVNLGGRQLGPCGIDLGDGLTHGRHVARHCLRPFKLMPRHGIEPQPACGQELKKRSKAICRCLGNAGADDARQGAVATHDVVCHLEQLEELLGSAQAMPEDIGLAEKVELVHPRAIGLDGHHEIFDKT